MPPPEWGVQGPCDIMCAGRKGDDDTPIDLLRGWREKWDKIYDKCFEEVFKSWSDDDWMRFDHDWKKDFKG